MVSIIIVNYNTFSYTENCIRSVFEKTKKTDFEIIVVSNSSSDKDIKELSLLFPSIRIIENEKNEGFAKANNTGIEHAMGDFILLLNSDTELLNDAISLCLHVLQTHAEIGIVSSQLNYPDGKLQSACQSFPSITADILETSRIFKLFKQDYIAQKFMNSRLDLNQNNYCDWVWGTFFMFRKSDLLKLAKQKLSDTFFMYGEDMEWCYQFHQIGLKSYYCAAAKITHHMGKSEFGNFDKKSATIIQNELHFVRTYFGNFYGIGIRFSRSLKFLIQSIKNPACLRLAKLYAFQK